MPLAASIRCKCANRRKVTSAGTTVNKFLAVSGGQTGFVAYPLSGVGDYTITQDKTKAVVVRVTYVPALSRFIP